MINVGGSSYNNGIRFIGETYSVSFEDKPGKTEITVKQNIAKDTSKFMRFLKKIPLVRGFVNVICKNKFLLAVFVVDLVLNVIMLARKTTETTTNTTSTVSEGLIIALMVLSILSVITSIALIIYLLSKMFVNMKNTWMYHGAEHKVIETNYAGKKINLDNCKQAPRVSDNCGTMLASIMIFIYLIIFVFELVSGINIWNSIELTLGITISYELFRVKRSNILLKPVFKLGYFLQEKCFTKEPNEHQLAQAMLTFSILEGLETKELTLEDVNEVLSEANMLP